MNLLKYCLGNAIGSKSSGIGSDDTLVVVTVTKSAEAGRFVADKTYAEVLAALNDDSKQVIFLLKINNARYMIDNIGCETISDSIYIYAQDDGFAIHPDEIFLSYCPNGLIYVTGFYTTKNMCEYQNKTETTATIPGDRTNDFAFWTFGELSSLTITNFPPDGVWRIYFTSGSTPTELSLPEGLLGLDDFECEANTKYMLELAFGVGYVSVEDTSSEGEEEET